MHENLQVTYKSQKKLYTFNQNYKNTYESSSKLNIIQIKCLNFVTNNMKNILKHKIFSIKMMKILPNNTEN